MTKRSTTIHIGAADYSMTMRYGEESRSTNLAAYLWGLLPRDRTKATGKVVDAICDFHGIIAAPEPKEPPKALPKRSTPTARSRPQHHPRPTVSMEATL